MAQYGHGRHERSPGGWRHAAARPFRRAVLRRIGRSLPAAVDRADRGLGDQHDQEQFPRAGDRLGPPGPGLVSGRHPQNLPLADGASRTAEYHGREYQELDNGTFIPRDVYDTVRRQTDQSLPTTGEGFYRRYVDLTYLRPYLAIPFFLAVFVLLLYFLGKFIAMGVGGLSAQIVERLFSRVPVVRAVYRQSSRSPTSSSPSAS